MTSSIELGQLPQLIVIIIDHEGTNMKNFIVDDNITLPIEFKVVHYICNFIHCSDVVKHFSKYIKKYDSYMIELGP